MATRKTPLLALLDPQDRFSAGVFNLPEDSWSNDVSALPDESLSPDVTVTPSTRIPSDAIIQNQHQSDPLYALLLDRQAEYGDRVRNLTGLEDRQSKTELARQKALQGGIDTQLAPYQAAQDADKKAFQHYQELAQFLSPADTVVRDTETANKIKAAVAPVEAAHRFDLQKQQLENEGLTARAKPQTAAIPRQVLDPKTGKATWFAPGQPIHGQLAGGSATERQEITSSKQALDNVETTLALGEQVGWKGVGVGGTLKNSLYKTLGIGDPNEDAFRQMLQKTRNDIMFGSGGKNLTPAEMGLAASWLADIDTNPSAAKNRLTQIRQMLQNHISLVSGSTPVPSSDENDPVDFEVGGDGRLRPVGGR